MAQRFDFIRVVGRRSGALVDGFIFLMMPSTLCCVTSEKQWKECEIPGCVLTDRAGRARELERWKWMVSILLLKRIINLLPFSSVFSVCV